MARRTTLCMPAWVMLMAVTLLQIGVRTQASSFGELATTITQTVGLAP